MVLKHQQLLKTPLFGLEEDEITWFSNSKRFSECCTVGLADVKLHGAQTHATLSSQNTLGSGRNCRILKQGCGRFCFVIIIPYPDKKANICSIRLRAEKGEV